MEVEPPITLEPGDVLLYSTAGFDLVKAGIQTMGGADVEHVEIYKFHDQFIRHQSWACRNGIGVGQYPTRWDGLVYVLRHETLLKSFIGFNPATANEYFRSVNHEGYGWGNLGEFFNVTILDDPKKLICSTFAALLLRAGGILVFAHTFPESKITPFDFRKTPALKQVYP